MKSFYKILLIEPNIEQADAIKQWLKNKAQIVHVTNNQDAKKQAALGDWHLVIADVNASEINDLEITQRVKETDSNTTILIIAKNIKVDFILTAMKYHADGLFFKPLDEKEFTARAFQLAEESKLKREKNTKIILAIGSHPDDIEFGCGGTLAKLRAENNEINILTLSLGATGGSPTLRKKEARLAAKLQGAKLYLGDLVDTKIDHSIETIQFIESVIQKVNPSHIYTHSFNDNHQDHKRTFQATLTASRFVPNVFSYLSPSSTIDFRPTIFINIDNYIDIKLNAIAAFTSQMDKRPYLQPDMIRATARYWGRFCNYTLVEPMEVIKQQL